MRLRTVSLKPANGVEFNTVMVGIAGATEAVP
jgi:hypothetical protein